MFKLFGLSNQELHWSTTEALLAWRSKKMRRFDLIRPGPTLANLEAQHLKIKTGGPSPTSPRLRNEVISAFPSSILFLGSCLWLHALI